MDVKLYPHGGRHYHRPECPLAQGPEYVTMPQEKVKLLVTMFGRRYRPCACMENKMPMHIKDIINEVMKKDETND